jgi:hypothetical protein
LRELDRPGIAPGGESGERAHSARRIGRTADARSKTRKTMIAALARKLLIALWRLVTTGEVSEGMALRAA